MRFRFCGDLDCPDWVLAEINTLSRITSVKMKLLCTQVVSDLLGTGIDYDKIYKLTSDAKYDSGDVKAAIAVLAYIITSATKHNVDEESLSNELQQLGLPKELTSALCKVYGEKVSQLDEHFKNKSLRFSHLVDSKWRIDFLMNSSSVTNLAEPVINLNLKVKTNDKEKPQDTNFCLTQDKFRVLHHELRQAYEAMDAID